MRNVSARYDDSRSTDDEYIYRGSSIAGRSARNWLQRRDDSPRGAGASRAQTVSSGRAFVRGCLAAIFSICSQTRGFLFSTRVMRISKRKSKPLGGWGLRIDDCRLQFHSVYLSRRHRQFDLLQSRYGQSSDPFCSRRIVVQYPCIDSPGAELSLPSAGPAITLTPKTNLAGRMRSVMRRPSHPRHALRDIGT